MASKVLKYVASSYARNSAEHLLFEGEEKRELSRLFENVFCNGIIISSGAMIAPVFSDSSVHVLRNTTIHCSCLSWIF